MRYKPAIERTVERCQALWGFEELEPPFCMVSAPEAPITSGGHDCEFWRDPDGFVAHHAPTFEKRAGIRDDAIPMLRPPFSHATVPAAFGAEVELHAGKLWTGPMLDSTREHERLSLPEENEWLGHLERYYRRLLKLAEGRFRVELCEIPGPADLMGALRGFESVLLDVCDDPEGVAGFARHAAELAAQFDSRVRGLVAEQESHGGCWIGSSWAPANTALFCEHTSVNYGPAQYARLLRPANAVLLSRYDRVLSYVYCKAGEHLLSHYFERGRPVWLRGCDEDPPAEVAQAYRGRAIVSVRTSVADFPQACERFGRIGVCYAVDCASLEEARQFCEARG